VLIAMGNAEGSHSASHTNSPQHKAQTLRNEKAKRHQRHKSASAVHELHVDINNDNYYTCKTPLSGVGPQVTAEPPATYFYQLPANKVCRGQSKTLAAPLVRERSTISDFELNIGLTPLTKVDQKDADAVSEALTLHGDYWLLLIVTHKIQ